MSLLARSVRCVTPTQVPSSVTHRAVFLWGALRAQSARPARLVANVLSNPAGERAEMAARMPPRLAWRRAPRLVPTLFPTH